MQAPEKKVQRPAAQEQWPVMAMLPPPCLSLSLWILSFFLSTSLLLPGSPVLFDSPSHLLCVSLPLLSSMSPPPRLLHSHTSSSPSLSYSTFLSLTCPWTPSGMPSDNAAHKMNFVCDVPFAQSQIWTWVPTGKDWQMAWCGEKEEELIYTWRVVDHKVDILDDKGRADVHAQQASSANLTLGYCHL